MQYLLIHCIIIGIKMISIQQNSFNVTAICSHFGNTKWPEDDYFGQKTRIVLKTDIKHS
jgi:hypothetical protein